MRGLAVPPLGVIRLADAFTPASVPSLLLWNLVPLPLLLLPLLLSDTTCCSGSTALAAGFAGVEPLILS